MCAAPCILIVEDLPSDVFLLQRALGNLPGDQPTLMYDGSLAGGLKSLAGGGVDIVFLDLHLLDSSGVDTLRAVRSAAPDVPVVVVSSSDSDETKQACRDAGALEFLAKGGYDSGDLRRVLATLE